MRLPSGVTNIRHTPVLYSVFLKDIDSLSLKDLANSSPYSSSPIAKEKNVLAPLSAAANIVFAIDPPGLIESILL